MSIYVMTVGELAKKRGEPVGEFVKKVQNVGFDAGSHAKKLTQLDLDNLIGLLDGNSTASTSSETKDTKATKVIENPNVLLINLENGKRIICVVDASLNQDGTIKLDLVKSTVEDSFGEALLEFRKQLGMNLGVN